MSNGKKPFFFCLTITAARTSARLAKKVGVVYASSEEEAKQLAWDEHGSDVACELWVEEIPETGYSFTVYKSSI